MKTEREIDFDQIIVQAKGAQTRLNELYRETIGLIDSLRLRSKNQMNLASDIEGGLVGKEDPASISDNIKALNQDIQEFNEVIIERINAFSAECHALNKSYNDAADRYNSGKGQLSALLEGRKRLLFIDARIRKFRAKINNMQQMNNILFSFAEELKEVKDSYKSNLIKLNSELAISLENFNETVRRIESLN